nr:zinc finger, CCHC-type [Tanacetum cinerariifolium]
MDDRLVYSGYPSVLEGYTDASWTSNTEDNSSTSGWVFLLGGAVGKEAEWLKNLLLDIPLWVKPMAPISIRCDNAATLAKAYSRMYNGKSRHLGVRHSRELIMNGVVSRVCEVTTKPSGSLDEGTPNSLVRKLGSRVQCGKLNIQMVEAHVLQIIPRMYLELAERRMKLLRS